MNIHPAFVHFPIAFSIVYAGLERVRPSYALRHRSRSACNGPDVDPIASFISHFFTES